jgi:flavin reductase (DIM6/NTAB) family NADH-FMN oxidoreductase RutF
VTHPRLRKGTRQDAPDRRHGELRGALPMPTSDPTPALVVDAAMRCGMIEMEPVTADMTMVRRAFGCFPSGVTAVCATVGGEPVGMAASSFTSVSVAPPLVSVCIQDTSRTWPKLRDRPPLGLSVLAEEHDAACLSLSRKVGDRFDGVSREAGTQGGVFVHGASAWLDCSLYAEVPAGNHAIALFRIHRLARIPTRSRWPSTAAGSAVWPRSEEIPCRTSLHAARW